MTFSTALYAVSGLGFAAAPGLTLEGIGILTRLVGLADTPPSTERFWLTLSISMMLMLVLCCGMVARDVARNLDFCIPVFCSKFCSTLLGALYFAGFERHGALLAIGWSDLPLGIVTLVLWRRARAVTGTASTARTAP